MTWKTAVLEAIGKVLPRTQYRRVAGSVIPSPRRRFCGPEFRDDAFYLKSAEGEAHRLTRRLGCTASSRILDVGCGQGRLAIGLLRVLGEVHYLGIDVDRSSIAWCRRFIERDHPSFRFTHCDVYNERYNRRGVRMGDGFRLDVEPGSIDIVYLFSVFSHTTEEDMRTYLKDFRRVLGKGGKVFFTTFVEERVPEISINPENYRLRCTGPLHVVRYEQRYLFSLLEQLGYAVLAFTQGTEVDGQSAIYLERAHG